MYKYISEEKPNRLRQPELDMAKFIAMLLMIVCHCGIYFYEEETVEYLIFDLVGGEFAAPVFMVCMGVGIVFSHHNHPEQLMSRGARLVLVGYLLNFIRGTIPELIVWSIDHSKHLFGFFESFYMVDILQFAGFAMVVLGLLKKWKVEPVYQVMIALLMVGLGDIMAEVSTGSEWIDAVCDLVWGANSYSYFPILNWFIYPAAGVMFGEILMHCNDKTALYKRLLPIGAVGVAISYYLIFTRSESYYSHNSYYFMGIENVVYGLCYPIFMFSLCYFISRHTKLGESKLITYSSKNLNTIYCISWVAILWMRYFIVLLCEVSLTGIKFLVTTVVVFVISYALCHLWLNIKKKNALK